MSTEKIIKIAVVGPESTGKSWLSQQLAAHYDTDFIPEYAREYCQDLNRNYTLEDEVNIFYGQLALEKKLIEEAKSDLIFCDTMALTVKIWCDHLFESTPFKIQEEIQGLHYDLYLLMDIDLPWQEDELRDFPHLREHFMNIWHQELKSISANYQIVSGQGNERFLSAKKIVDDFLRKNAGL